MDGAQPDDEQYPTAPVPPHERIWRHPSEIGEATWQHNEPPLAIGRGLLVTTGAIGALLALTVLWATLPTDAGRRESAVTTVVAQALRPETPSTVRTASGAPTNTRGTTPTTQRATPTTRVGSVGPATTFPASPDTNGGTAFSPATNGTTAASKSGSSSIASSPVDTIGVSKGSLAEHAAIAVAVGDSPLVITTAGAVASDNTVTLWYGSGESTEAKVVMVRHGLAVLSPDVGTAMQSFPVAAAPQPGDSITLLGDTPVSLAVHVDADGTMTVDSWGDNPVAEGTPVVNAAGELVGLCSHDANGPTLLLVDDISSLRAAVEALTASTNRPVWMGVQLNADPAGSLTVNAVDQTGPAALAGIVAGDTIMAIDGVAMASSGDLVKALARHTPDDQVDITVQHGNGAQSTVPVILAVRTSTM